MKNLTLITISLITTAVFGQELRSSNTYISFFSEKESIKAENSEVMSSLNVATGEISYTVDISKFIFPSSLMQKHFNQKDVMHSVAFPKAYYEGKITNNGSVDYTTDGEYPVKVNGTMKIKGVSKDFSADGKILIEKGAIIAYSTFSLDRYEYGVDGKSKSVSQILEITVKGKYSGK
jgi:polyisoprenoid-binding protein YceI